MDGDRNKTISVHDAAELAEREFKLPVGILRSLGIEESHGLNQYDASGNLIRSGTGPTGAYQFTKKTAAQYGGNRDNPIDNTIMAAQYLRDNYSALRNDLDDEDEAWLAAAVAHNRGLGAVKQMISNRRFTPSGKDSGNGGDTAKYATLIANNWAEYREKATKAGIPVTAPESAEPATEPVEYGSISPSNPTFVTPENYKELGLSVAPWELPGQKPTPTVQGTSTLKAPIPGGSQGLALSDNDGNLFKQDADQAKLAPGEIRVIDKEGKKLIATKGEQGYKLAEEKQYSPEEIESGYREYLGFTKAADSPETKQKYLDAIKGNIPTGEIASIEARPDAKPNLLPRKEVAAQTGAPAPYSAKSIQEYNAEQEAANPEFYITRSTLPQAYKEIKNDDDFLNTIAGTVAVDLRRKPVGMNAGEYQFRTAAKALQPQYGYTDQDIERVVQDYKTKYGKLSRQNYPDVEGEQYNALVQQAIQANGTPYGSFSLHRRAINDLLGGKDKSQLDLEKSLVAKEIAPLPSPVTKTPAWDEMAAREYTKKELASPTLGDAFERGTKKAVERLPYFLSPLGMLYAGISDFKAEIETASLPDEERVNKRLADLIRTHGSLANYQNAKDARERMNTADWTVALSKEFGRSFLKTFSSGVKGVELLGDYAEKYGVFSLIPEQYRPSIRNVGNLLNYAVAATLNPKQTENIDFKGENSEIRQRLFYSIADEFDKSLGDDPVLRDTWQQAISNALGSSSAFLLMGMVAPQASIAGRFNLSAATLGMMSSAGSGYEEARKGGLSEEQSRKAGLINGIAGLSEGFGVGAAVNRAIVNQNLKRQFISNFTNYIKDAGTTFAKEGAEEYLQEFFQSTVGKATMDALKDQEPDAYQRILNIANRLPSQMAESASDKGTIAAFLTGGGMGTTTNLSASFLDSNPEPKVDLNNNLIEIEGERFEYPASLRTTVESWINQQNGLQALYQEFEQLQKESGGKSDEDRMRIQHRFFMLEKELNALTQREASLMAEIGKNIVPVNAPDETEAPTLDTEKPLGLTSTEQPSNIEAPAIEPSVPTVIPLPNTFSKDFVAVKDIGIGEIVEQTAEGTQVKILDGKQKGQIVTVQKGDILPVSSNAVAQGLAFEKPQPQESVQAGMAENQLLNEGIEEPTLTPAQPLSEREQANFAKAQKLANKKPRAKQAPNPKKHSLATYVRLSGGIAPSSVIDLEPIKNAKQGKFIVNKNGRDIEDVFRDAVESGYLSGLDSEYERRANNESGGLFTIDDFVNAIASDANGSTKYFAAQAIDDYIGSPQYAQDEADYYEGKTKEKLEKQRNLRQDKDALSLLVAIEDAGYATDEQTRELETYLDRHGLERELAPIIIRNLQEGFADVAGNPDVTEGTEVLEQGESRLFRSIQEIEDSEDTDDSFDVAELEDFEGSKSADKADDENAPEQKDQSTPQEKQNIVEQTPESTPLKTEKAPEQNKAVIDTSESLPPENSLSITYENYEDFRKFAQAVREGEVSSQQLKDSFEYLVTHQDAISESLQKMTIAELKKRFNSHRAKTKNEWVEDALNSMLRFYTLNESVVVSGFVSPGQNWKQKEIDAYREIVEKFTDADIQEYVESVKAQKLARAEKMAEYKNALEDPKTLVDFEIFLRYKKFSELSPAQKEHYDSLVAEKTWDEQAATRAKNEIVEKIELEDTDLTISKHFHTKHQKDIWIVSLSDRVDRDKYNELNIKAKQLGGRYAREWKPTNTPAGFQFFNEETANKFIGLQEADVSRAEELQQRKARKQMSALERLRDSATSLESGAQEELNKNRLVNTARRARMADNIEKRAESDLAMAVTMKNVAEAIESGKVKYLTEIWAKTHFETLERILRRSVEKTELEKQKEAQENKERYEAKFRRTPTAEDITNADFPYPTVFDHDLRSFQKAGQTIDGVKLLARRLAKNVTVGKPIRRASNLQTLKELITRLKRNHKTKSDPLVWRFENDVANLNRLESIGLTNPAILREALREYLPLRKAVPAENIVKKLERELVGTNYGREQDYFPTPPELARRLAETADIRSGMLVLEPSAGKGNIIDEIVNVQPEIEVDAIELLPKLRQILEAKGYNVIADDFLDFEPTKDYDRVIMNPPFKNEIQHIRKAYDLLKPGGRLVAITSPSWTFNKSKEAQAFRDFVEEIGGYEEPLPDNSFGRGEVATNVNTRLLVIDKSDSIASAFPKANPSNLFPKDLFGESVAPTFQADMFAGQEAANDTAINDEITETYGSNLGSFILNPPMSGKILPIVNTLIDFRRIVAQKGKETAKLSDNIFSAIEIYGQAVSQNIPVEEVLQQPRLDDVEFTDQAKRFAQAMEDGDFNDLFQKALFDIPNEEQNAEMMSIGGIEDFDGEAFEKELESQKEAEIKQAKIDALKVPLPDISKVKVDSVEVVFSNGEGRTLTKKMSPAERKAQLQRKQAALEMLLNCVNK